MRLVKYLLITVLLMGSTAWAMTETRTECVEFQGIELCETKTFLKVGEKEVPIEDPWELLNSIGNSEAEKIGFWDIYKYPPFLTELARQLKLTEDEVILALKDEDPSWMALYELTQIYKDAKGILSDKGVDRATIDKLFNMIIMSITNDIKMQLKDFEGEKI